MNRSAHDKEDQTSTDSESIVWTYAILSQFAEAVQVGELSTGLKLLSGLSDPQYVDVVNNSIALIDRGMAGQITGAPARLSAFGGITIPPASELDARGYTTPARGILVSIWNHRVDLHLTELATQKGLQKTSGVVVLAAACMLLTWQLETNQSLEDIFDNVS